MVQASSAHDDSGVVRSFPIDVGHVVQVQQHFRPINIPASGWVTGLSATRFRFGVWDGHTAIITVNFDGPKRVEVISTEAGRALGGDKALAQVHALLTARLSEDNPMTSGFSVQDIAAHPERPNSRRLAIKWGQPKAGELRFLKAVYLLEMLTQIMVDVHAELQKADAVAQESS